VTFVPDTNKTRSIDKNALTETLNQIKFEALVLKSSYDPAIINAKFDKLETLLSSFSFLSEYKRSLAFARSNYLKIRETASAWKNYVPRIAFMALRINTIAGFSETEENIPKDFFCMVILEHLM